MNFTGYEGNGYFDEMIGEDGRPRATAHPLAQETESLPEESLLVHSSLGGGTKRKWMLAEDPSAAAEVAEPVHHFAPIAGAAVKG